MATLKFAKIASHVVLRGGLQGNDIAHAEGKGSNEILKLRDEVKYLK